MQLLGLLRGAFEVTFHSPSHIARNSLNEVLDLLPILDLFPTNVASREMSDACAIFSRRVRQHSSGNSSQSQLRIHPSFHPCTYMTNTSLSILTSSHSTEDGRGPCELAHHRHENDVMKPVPGQCRFECTGPRKLCEDSVISNALNH
jgi:hypothetical protein